MLSFYVWMEKGREHEEEFPVISLPKGSQQQEKNVVHRLCGTFNKQQLETLYAYLNNFNDARNDSGQFQLWVYYPTSVDFEFINWREKDEKWSQLRTTFCPNILK